ncbi:MAG: toll/interleukin-1 receptor domain-containing protein, partial [Bdellovibrio sp.]|nr:toll/interleukin-1 receptor domain-containing protein [Bdellovibrio sp.]
MPKKEETPKIKVFISHAVANEAIAHKLVDLLVSGVGLRSYEIFCSSLLGHSISTGKGFVEKILSALIEADVVITILTPNYYESIFCIAELGGAWTLKKDPYPIVVSPLKMSDVSAVLLGRQAMKIEDEEALDVMFDDLKRDLKIAGNATPIWTRKKKEFIEQVVALIPEQPKPR